MVKMYTPWVTPLENGKFLVQQKYVDPLKSTSDKKVLSKVSKTIKKDTPQARNIAFEYLREKILTKVNDQAKGSDITFKNLSDKYQEYLEATKKAWNTRRITYHNLRFINEYFNGAIAKNITTPFINRYLTYLLYYRKPRTYSNSSVRIRKSIISNVYNYGIEQGYVKTNPTKGVKVKWKNENKKKRERIENKYLTDTELRAALGYIKYVDGRYDYYCLFKTLSSTGMRFNEAAGLKKNNLHITKNGSYLSVTGSQEFHYGKLAENEKINYRKSDHPKTFASYRKVIIDDSLVKLLESIKKENTDYLLVNSNNRPWNISACNEYLKKLTHKLGIQKQISTHYFRHTYISKLVEKGVPLNVIMKQVGQADSEITRKIYTHITENEVSILNNQLKNISKDINV